MAKNKPFDTVIDVYPANVRFGNSRDNNTPYFTVKVGYKTTRYGVEFTDWYEYVITDLDAAELAKRQPKHILMLDCEHSDQHTIKPRKAVPLAAKQAKEVRAQLAAQAKETPSADELVE